MTIETLHDSPTRNHLAFLERLTSGGQALVPPFDAGLPPEVFDCSEVQSFYPSLHAARAEEAPRRAPELNLRAAIWGGLVFHWACWAILDRGEDEDFPERLQATMPDPIQASSHWSVDLILGAWPEVHDRCKQVSQDDPLRLSIVELAITWPLSAIGLGLDSELVRSKILSERVWETVIAHPTLRRIAADRAERSDEADFLRALTGFDATAARR